MRKRFFTIIAILMAIVFLVPTSVNASAQSVIKSAQNSSSTLKSNSGVKKGTIPAEYSFGFGKIKSSSPKAIYGGYTKVTTAQKNAWKKFSANQTFNATFEKNTTPTVAKAGYTVCYPKMGVYNDNYIDVKGEVLAVSKVTNNKSYNNAKVTPIIAFDSGRVNDSAIKQRPGVEANAINWVKVKWSFHKSNGKCTGTAVSVKGNTTYWDVDLQQGVAMPTSEEKTTTKYISNNNNKLYYTTLTTDAGTKYKYVFSKDTTGQSAKNKNYAYTETFSGKSITRLYTFYKKANGQGRGGITQSYNAVNPVIPPNPTKKASVKKVTESTKYTYTITQKVPLQDSTNYHTSFVISDTLDKAIDMTKITTSNVKVVRKDDNKTVSGSGKYFTIKKSGQTITATATKSALKDENFYGETYQLIIPAQIKSNYNFSSYKKDSNGYYIIPDVGKTVIDNKSRTTNQVDVLYKPGEPNKTNPPVKSVDTKYVADGSKFTYRVKQVVPNQVFMNYYKSFEIIDTLDPAIDMEKTKAQGIKVVRTDTGAVVSGTNGFYTITVSGNKVTASATSKALSDSTFYNKTYELVIPSVLKSNYDFSSYKKDGDNYIIPNKAITLVNKTELKSNEVDVLYNKDIPVKSVDAEVIRPEKEFNYTIKHSVPELNNNSYYQEYTFTDVLEEPLQIKDSSKVKITDNTGADVTSNFNVAVEGQKVTASLKNTQESSFYGKDYSFTLTVSLRSDYEESVSMEKYLDENRYVIPDTATISIKNNQGELTELKTNTVYVYFYPEITPKKSVDTDDVSDIYTNGGTFTYTIEKDVINYSKNSWYSSFELKDVFESPISISEPGAVKIMNDLEENVTEWFDININGNTLTATLKDEYNNESFYGRSYKFIITAGIKKDANLEKYKKGNYYVIPNKASIIYDKNIENQTNEVTVKIEVPKEVPKVVPKKKKYYTPNTASPLSIAVIIIGISLVGAAIYFVYKNYVPSMISNNNAVNIEPVVEKKSTTPKKSTTTKKSKK